MLLVDERVIKLEKKYQKILHVSPALNNSTCFLGIKGHRQDCITHVDKNGKILGEIVFEDGIDSFAMTSERELAVLETRKDNILVWDLQNHSVLNIPFSFKFYQSDQSQIIIFPITKTICILQKGKYNNNFFRLTYFYYPLAASPQILYQFEDEEAWTYEYMIRKGNNHSMICWFKGRHDDGFQFRTFDLRDQNLNDPKLSQRKIDFKTHKFDNDIGKKYPNNPKVEVAITTMWQMTPNKFMLVCISSLSNTIQEVNNNYVYESDTGIFRTAKFDFGKYNDLLIDQYSFGSTCMFKTFDFDNGLALETPVYFINNETEEIITEQKWKCSYLYKYDFSGYDGNLILQYKYENGNVEEIIQVPKKIMEPREILTHFMLELYEGWDQDLIRSVVEIVDTIKK